LSIGADFQFERSKFSLNALNLKFLWINNIAINSDEELKSSCTQLKATFSKLERIKITGTHLEGRQIYVPHLASWVKTCLNEPIYTGRIKTFLF
jgi:hypothetical protein